MIWCVRKQLWYGCPNNRPDSSCTRCQRLCEHGDNWLQANVSGFHIAQIRCQSKGLSLDFPLQNILDNFKQKLSLFIFIVVLNKRWMLRVDQISNRQSVMGFCHRLVSLSSQICFYLPFWMETLFTYKYYLGQYWFQLPATHVSNSTLHRTQLLTSSLGHHSNPLWSTSVIHVFPHIPVSTEWAEVQQFTGLSVCTYGWAVILKARDAQLWLTRAHKSFAEFPIYSKL